MVMPGKIISVEPAPEKKIRVPWWKQTKNAFVAARRAGGRMVSGGEVLVAPEVRTRRMAICRSCTYYLSRSGRCTECGCYVTVKARLATEDCPAKLWPSVRGRADGQSVPRKKCGACIQREKARSRSGGKRRR